MKKNIVNIAAQRQLIAAKSQEMQNTVAGTPSWLIRYGLSAFFVTLLIIVGFGMVLRFPERILAPVAVINENGQQAIRIWVEEKDTSLIKAGQQATVWLKNEKDEQTLEIKGQTGTVKYSSQVKRYFVQILPEEGTQPQIPDSNTQGKAQITYNRRTLMEQVLNTGDQK